MYILYLILIVTISCLDLSTKRVRGMLEAKCVRLSSTMPSINRSAHVDSYIVRDRLREHVSFYVKECGYISLILALMTPKLN